MDGSQISPDSGMDFISATGTILYYITLPIVTTFWLVLKLLQVILAPIIGLLKVFIAVALLPIRWIAKFETIITYVGVAALIGLITGTVLHLSSNVLISLLNLKNLSESVEKGRTAASVRAAREQRVLEKAWQSSSTIQQSSKQTGSDSLEDRYVKWLEKDPSNAKKNLGLFGQTILEEDDSSMDGF